VIKNPDPKEAKRLNNHHRAMVRRALELIRDKSTLNLRILTRSPLARADFDLMKTFGSRLTFGMSLPTLDDKLARIYEPSAPVPSKRLETLKAAVAAGLHVYVAVAPTYPECDETDIRATLTAVAKLNPITVFHEPINVRAENVERIKVHATSLGVTLKTEVFADDDARRKYAVEQLQLVEKIAGEVGLAHCLHLWPDKDLPSKAYLQSLDDPTGFVHWLTGWWTRVSEWPV
jgi:DNA repair photolyase